MMRTLKLLHWRNYVRRTLLHTRTEYLYTTRMHQDDVGRSHMNEQITRREDTMCTNSSFVVDITPKSLVNSFVKLTETAIAS